MLEHTYKNRVTKEAVSRRNLDVIIEDVRNGSYEKSVKDIRQEHDLDKRRNLKRELLPAFSPCVQFVGSTDFYKNKNIVTTGLIQFDIDDIDISDSLKLKNDLKENIEELVYVYISPSGGLKFAVNTDFIYDGKPNKETKYTFIKAYELVEQNIKNKVNIIGSAKIDKRCSDIGQLCYLSFDDDAYHNNSAPSYCIYHQALELRSAEKKKEDEKISSQRSEYFSDASDDLIFEALLSIPTDSSYDIRRDVLWALMHHFSDTNKVESIMMSHWVKSDMQKLNKQIKGLIKDYKPRGITLGSLFDIAKDNGFRFSASSCNKNPKETESKATYNRKIISLDEGKNILDDEINDFFINKTSKVIDITAGSGKTRKVVDSIIKSVWKDGSTQLPTIAIYVRSGPLAIEMYDLIKERTNDYIAEKGFSNFQTLKNLDQHYVSIIKGRGKHGCEYDEQKDVAKICKENTCQIRDKCGYIDQFSVFNNIRIYAHSYLFKSQPSSFYESVDGFVGKGNKAGKWVPDYVIVDEDIIASQFLDNSEIKTIKAGKGFNSISKIINAIDQHGLSVRESVKKYLVDIDSDWATYSTRYECRWLKELLDWSEDLQTNEHMNNSRFKISGSELKYFGKKELRNELKKKPILLLDASSDEMLVNDVLGCKLKYVSVDIEYQDKVKVIQLGNKSYSKSSITEKDEVELISFISKKSENKNVGLITYQHSNEKKDNCFLKSMAERLNIDERYTSYFGNARATNKFEELDMLFIIGRHQVHDDAIDDMYRQIYGGKSNIDGNSDLLTEKTLYDKRVIRMSSGQNMSVTNRTYIDAKKEAIFRLVNDAETYQAAHRLRLLHGNNNKTVYLLSNRVINLTVDELILANEIKKKKKNIQKKTIDKLNLIVNTIKVEGSISSIQGNMANKFNFNSVGHYKKFKTQNNLEQYLLEHNIVSDESNKMFIYKG